MNVEDRIAKTIETVLNTKTNKILLVINGCTDNTLEKALAIKDTRVNYLYFNKALGLDVPRSIGAYIAYREGASSFVFVDGDMIGDIHYNLNEIINDITKNKVDMGLTDCYPYGNEVSNKARVLLAFRKQLNTELSIFNKIGYATPSHGPHGISRRLIDKIGFEALAIPPVSLALAILNNFGITVSTKIPDEKLQSITKDTFHAKQVTKTIIGDCIEALYAFNGQKRKRGFDGEEFLGYHKTRRLDILHYILKNEINNIL